MITEGRVERVKAKDKILNSTVLKLGDNINTDYIIPTKYLDLYEPEDLGQHVFEGLGEKYPELIKGHSVVIGGENFGLGICSS
jgi:3-isopropylmalate/(R)-2-methylmalate dehydratase small subunit